MRRLWKTVVSFFLAICAIFAVSNAAFAGENVQKKSTRRDIAIVFDNSGSMYMQGNKAWCQATYAMEVFASMMNKGDILKIYPMNEIEVNGSTYSAEDPLEISDPVQASIIQNIFTPKGGDTFISTINAAYQGLKGSKLDEQWLIVLTDGEVFYEPDEKELTPAETKTRLSEVLSSYAETVHTMYLGIGSVAALPEITGRYANPPVTAASAEVPAKLSSMCNTIFGRDILPEKYRKGSEVSFDIPLSKLIVFAQGADVTGLVMEGQNTIEILGTKAGTLGAGNYEGSFGIASELQGIIATVEDLPAGTYELSYQGTPENVEIYYEPDADLQISLRDPTGESVPCGETYSGSYNLTYAITDSEGIDISASELLGNKKFDIEIEYNGEQVALPDNTAAGAIPFLLKAGDTLKVGKGEVRFLKDYVISKSGLDFGFPQNGISVLRPDNSLVLNITGGKTEYRLSELEDCGQYEVEAVYNGECLGSEEFSKIEFDRIEVTGGDEGNEKAENPEAELTVDGDHAIVRLNYNEDAEHTKTGEQSFILRASYDDLLGDTSQGETVVSFVVIDDTSVISTWIATEKKYYVLGDIGKSAPVIINVRKDGGPLTDEELRLISEEGRVCLITPDGLSVDTLQPIYGESAFRGEIRRDGTKTGFYKVSAEVSMPTSRNKKTEYAGTDGYVEISSVPKWVKLLTVLGILLLLAMLILFILTRKILPKDIYILDDETVFKSGRNVIKDFRPLRYGKKSIFARFAKEASFTVITPQDIKGNSIPPVTLKIRSVSNVIDAIFSKKQCKVSAVIAEPSTDVSELTVSGENFILNKKDQHFYDTDDKPIGERAVTLREGSDFETIDKSHRLQYNTILHFKW